MVITYIYIYIYIITTVLKGDNPCHVTILAISQHCRTSCCDRSSAYGSTSYVSFLIPLFLVYTVSPSHPAV